jgi:hypothetical protein
MKIRNGFVSNSSSSSFLIYGSFITDSQINGISREVLEKIIEDNKLDIETFFGEGDDYQYIGKSWDSIKDDETGKQFKSHIEEEVKKN